MALILNQAQAKLAYEIIDDLNGQSANIGVAIIRESDSGQISVKSNSGGMKEHYENQSAFATAYGLN